MGVVKPVPESILEEAIVPSEEANHSLQIYAGEFLILYIELLPSSRLFASFIRERAHKVIDGKAMRLQPSSHGVRATAANRCLEIQIYTGCIVERVALYIVVYELLLQFFNVTQHRR